MKRMTKKIGGHYTFHDCEIICDKCFGGCKVSQQIMDKYGELEDLLEEELGTVDLELTKSVFDEWHSYLQFAGERSAFERMLGDVAKEDKIDWERLRELVQADREGRCVVLPCKIGDTIYQVDYMTHGEALRAGVPEKNDPRSKRKFGRRKAEYLPLMVREKKMVKSLYSEFGKNVFLTRAEAEAALRREQDG